MRKAVTEQARLEQ